MTIRFLATLALPLFLTACSSDLPSPPAKSKTNSISVEADLKTLEIPKHALGEGWERVSHEHSTVPGAPGRGAFKGVGESQKLEVTFTKRVIQPVGMLTLVVSTFASKEDAESMYNIILITRPNAKFTESTLFGYNAYDYQSTKSTQVGKMLILGNLLVTVFADDARDLPAQERLVRYLFSKLSIPIPQKK